MTQQFITKQEEFWAGEFGDKYILRNNDAALIANNTALFAKILKSTCNINSVLELGANIGLNLIALKNLLPKAQFSGVEINGEAANILKKNLIKMGEGHKCYHKSIFDFKVDCQRDFVLIKGVLIHINPEMLNLVYDLMYSVSAKYICIAEYYNPTPVEVNYRDNEGFLFKRDFAGEILERYPLLKLRDYGFVYHRDVSFPQDDISWFLLEK
jgi:spore coat polysaccharide biosynthesis protein SpsF